MIKKYYLKILIFAFLFFYSNIGLSNNSINFIDMDILMNNSLAGQSIKKQLNEIKETNNKNFKKKEEELKKSENKIISKKNVLNEIDYKKEVKLFNVKVSEYKKTREKIINDISLMQNKAEKALVKSLRIILSDYSKKNSIPYILSKQAIIIGETESDLTSIILEILNDKIKSIQIKKI